MAVPRGFSALESSAEIVNIPLAMCCDWQGFTYTKSGWHYFGEMLREYKVKPKINYRNSILKKYYDNYQPKSTFECFLCEEEYDPLRHSTPWVTLPWKSSFQVSLSDNQHFGPNSNTFIRKELVRTISLYHRLEAQGYQPQKNKDGYIRGHFLKKGKNYRFKVSAGQHRMAVLGVIGQKDLNVKIQPYWKRIIDIRHIHHWEHVKNGTYSEKAARKIFNFYFETTGIEKAENTGCFKEGEIWDMTIPTGVEALDSTSPTVMVPLDKCVDWQGFTYTAKGWHYLCETIKEYRKKPKITYRHSILYQYYSLYQPKSMFECLMCEDAYDPVNSDGPWVPLPWGMGHRRVPEEGNQHYGPNTKTFIRKEFKRLVHIYEKLKEEGYQPTHHHDGFIKGHFLKKGRDYRFLITGGQHRIAALAMLGYESILARIPPRRKRVIDLEDMMGWDQVVNGNYPPEVATHVFHMYFDLNGREKASLYGLADMDEKKYFLRGNRFVYQDIWVKGKLVKKGQRECANRYEKVKEKMKEWDDRFTVLDLGANNGYFSYRIAEDFQVPVTMIEAKKEARKIYDRNENPHVTLINRRVDVKELKELCEKQKFGVVLALSVLHHFDNYEEVIDVLFAHSKHLFIESSALEEAEGGCRDHTVEGIHKLLQAKKPETLTYTDNIRGLGKRPLMYFNNQIG
ncbi:methyltransferase domain-containing protein [Halobacillus karajensis]|uniref:tRNA mo(5)U34 methyltransferase n=2 Tax=Halobacillus karajensis TaxID=195088 RepID=A0A024P499_9BACI|nr:methyltransferase domain-containing protein [Halobacillus karajensis]CDQ20641.1 tRNA mo(5)U34 methyltransferase [Halobacillus karajensis]CDQ23889.1 tRNA mo(5)U34 methyltransferase [Halobacillus karajensis]CDQ27367.1 tRNA mo(5)U34 methyltransferase [Halobacillus karajensis]